MVTPAEAVHVKALAGQRVQVALLRAQEQLETMLADLLRRHRREQFA
jgi:hypothetical protein